MYFSTMHDILLQLLTINFSFKKSRLECLAGMIISLVQHCSVSAKNIAIGIDSNILPSSKVHKVYRFFREQKFNYDQVAKLILALFPSDKYILALDRTCWKFGTKDINILFLVIVIGKISVPIYWYPLEHGGACTTSLMEEILERFIGNFGIHRIKYLLADREFMSKEWLNFLKVNQIKFAIPLRKDMKIRLKGGLQIRPVGDSFNGLKHREYMEVEAIMWLHELRLSAYRNDKGELMVVAASKDIDVEIFALYKYRWSIERLFKHLKSSGFDIEKSHITDLDRFCKLIAVCAIATGLIIKNGLIQNTIVPIKIRKHKHESGRFSMTPVVSFFTYGLDHIRNCFNKSAAYIKQRMREILEWPIILDQSTYFPTLLQKL